MEFYITPQHCSPEQLLRERFHITTGFHPGQREIIEQLVQKKRVLAIQRTGWGKSLCYQMASLYHPHLTVIFSPLKALMRDQCQRCNDVYAIPAAIVSSDFSEEENKATLARAIQAKIKILFIAPERLDNLHWQRSVSQMRISMIVIDEAHCISTWGHDFRPHYHRIVQLLDAIPADIPVLALTATANKHVEEDILQQIGSAACIARGTMERPNLFLHAVHMNGDADKLSYLLEILPSWPGTGIIYTATKEKAEMVAMFLASQGISADYYHAGREDHVRQDIERALMYNTYKVICSTNALGMGIDKRDVRFVIHYNIPASPIHYYQEMGRAGRDGATAHCLLLYDPSDLAIQEYFIESSKPTASCYTDVLNLLQLQARGRTDIMRMTGYKQQSVQTILADLEEQHCIERLTNNRVSIYQALRRPPGIDFSVYDRLRQRKKQELEAMQNYTAIDSCLMGYLTAYLGDRSEYRCGVCGHCQSTHFPVILQCEKTQHAAETFLEKMHLPPIEKRGGQRSPSHEAGWSLTYHGNSSIGQMVRACKYEQAGPFPDLLIDKAVQVIRERYPLVDIDAIVAVPPTKSGMLVELFARRIATLLDIEYLAALCKTRSTQEQKIFSNRVQKEDNVKDAFAVSIPTCVKNKTLLLVDDIYDSGYTMKAVGHVLMKAGAKAVYPFTITRTLHSDDQ